MHELLRKLKQERKKTTKKHPKPSLFLDSSTLVEKQKPKLSQIFLFEITNLHTHIDGIKGLIENCSPFSSCGPSHYRVSPHIHGLTITMVSRNQYIM